jgi:hypothetical protein
MADMSLAPNRSLYDPRRPGPGVFERLVRNAGISTLVRRHVSFAT